MRDRMTKLEGVPAACPFVTIDKFTLATSVATCLEDESTGTNNHIDLDMNFVQQSRGETHLL